MTYNNQDDYKKENQDNLDYLKYDCQVIYDIASKETKKNHDDSSNQSSTNQ
ncbi:MAG: hypothetical protein HQL32_10315 [Planctomycetes bacterium]|nr:hypothetical protein [Planctomycetota bacterium]